MYKLQNEKQAVLSLSGIFNLVNSVDGEGIYWTTDPLVELPIRLTTSGPGSESPITVPQRFLNTVKAFPDRPSLRWEGRSGIDDSLNEWLTLTWSEFYSLCVSFALSLLSMNCKRGDVVAIIGFNSPEWIIANLGAILAGCIPTGIYSTSSIESLIYIFNHSKAKVVVLENEIYLKRIQSIRSRLPHLQTIVQWSDYNGLHQNGVYFWKDFLKVGSNSNQNKLNEVQRTLKPGHCCTLIYTSGTTGNPKAVMISHDNLTWVSSVASKIWRLSECEDFVSFLPLSHVAAQIIDIYVPLYTGSTVSFAKPDALKGSLVQTLASVRPTLFLGVPRVWEKIMESMKLTGSQNSGIKKTLVNWAKSVGLKANQARIEGLKEPWGYTLAAFLVFHEVRKKLGLDRTLRLGSAAAPISDDTVDFFMSLDCPILEIFGMSECSGPHSVSAPESGMWRPGWAGKPMPGVETLVAIPQTNSPKKLGEEGEILLRGRHCMMGYLCNKSATKSTIDSEGWLHSGDLGIINDSGFLKITGRIKELIKTAGGEYVMPIKLEQNIKALIPAVSQALIVGDGKKYVSVLLTLKAEIKDDSEILIGQSLDFARNCGSEARTSLEASKCPKFLNALQKGINEVNKQAPNRPQVIQKFTILPKDFSESGGEITPSQKVKRNYVLKKYKREIDKMYSNLSIPTPRL